jgi:hypothetical protein
MAGKEESMEKRWLVALMTRMIMTKTRSGVAHKD